jgi:hypothetical protein
MAYSLLSLGENWAFERPDGSDLVTVKINSRFSS